MALKGNGCVKCHIKVGEIPDGCFHFHHRNPEDKEICIGDHRGKKIDIVKEVMNKCDLLCYLCHTEEHEKEECHGTKRYKSAM